MNAAMKIRPPICGRPDAFAAIVRKGKFERGVVPMDVGVGLPATIPGVNPGLILDWARRADAGPYVGVGVIDRIVYDNFEPLVTLAAVAAVTSRVRLLTGVIVAPTRDPATLAKQAASVDALSGGRLTLGLAVGVRGDDFRATGSSYSDRGKRFDAQLALMKRIWSGEPMSDDIGPIGPPPARPGGPELLIGGFAPSAIARAARWGDGYIGGSGGPEMSRPVYAAFLEAWRRAGRDGRPRLVGGSYFALGPDARDRAAAYIRDYYAFYPPFAEEMIGSMPVTVGAIRDMLQRFEDIGANEVALAPTIADIDQLSRLTDVLA